MGLVRDKCFSNYYSRIIEKYTVDRFYKVNSDYGIFINNFRVVVTNRNSHHKVSINLSVLNKINLETQLVLKFKLTDEILIHRLSGRIMEIVEICEMDE